MNGYANGHANGHSNGHNGKTDEASTHTLKEMLDMLNREITTVKQHITLKSGDKGLNYVVEVNETIEVFRRRAAEMIAEADANIERRVHQRHHVQARRYVNQLSECLGDIENAARHLDPAAKTMVEDLFSSMKRAEATRASQEVLSAIARFFLICDQLDVYFMIQSIDLANSLLHDLRNCTTTEEIEEKYNMLLEVLKMIDESTSIRLADVRSNKQRDSIMAAHTLVKSSVPLVYSTTKAVLHHPEAAALCDSAHSDMHNALGQLQSALDGKSIEGSYASSSYLDGYGRLAAELQHFQSRFMMDPSQYRGNRDRADLEEILERIVTGSAGIADEPSTRHERKHKIIGECNQLRQALQELLKEYESNRGRAETSEDMDMAMVLVERRMKDLKRHLRRAIIDNVGDAFLDRKTPLLVLIEVAGQGLRAETEQAAGTFEDHAKRLVEVAKLSTEMSMDREGIRHVKFASEQVSKLIPQVIDAAFLLCENPHSQMAKDHMEVMRKTWESRVHALTLGVGALISLDDFLAVTESHLLEDSMVAISAIADSQVAQVDSSCGAIRGRCLRVYDMVDDELESLEIGGMTGETVKQANRILRDEVRRFEDQSSLLLDRLDKGGANLTQQQRTAEVQEFSDSCSLVLNAVKNIRNALLVNRNPDDVDSDNEYEDDGVTHADQKSMISDAADNQQRVMRHLPEEDKKKIQKEVEIFNLHQKKFEQEMATWDDSDIILLAKRMCAILGDMMDFTRGRGNLKSTSDVIDAAQEIAEAGKRLSVLARQIGDVAEESNSTNEQLKSTKKDLVSYLSKMALYCHQLNICSRVKADVSAVSDGIVVKSALDSALSLTLAARNLLTAVVSAVKSSYILSTKFPTASGAPGVSWKMTAPRKQPLVQATPSPAKNGGREGGKNILRRASERRAMPIHALSEFTR